MNTMDYFLQALSVFGGVIAGVFVSAITEMLINRQQEKQKLRNLEFELQANIKKLDEWLDELSRYRNAINSDTVSNYFGYFDFARALIFAVNELLRTGTLYRYLTFEDISRLQVVFYDLSPGGEAHFNNQVNMERQEFLKPRAVTNLNFWEERLKEHRKVLQEIVLKLR